MEQVDSQKETFSRILQKRLKEFVESHSKSVNSFETEVGLTHRTIRNVIEGRNLPSLHTLFSLKQHFPDMDLNWLISDEEDISSIISDPKVQYIKGIDTELLKKYNELKRENSCLKDKLIKLYEKLTDNSTESG